MQRVREHRTDLSKLIKDDRLSPNRRLLAELFALYIDADQEKRQYAGKNTPKEEFDEAAAARDKALFHDVIRSEFVNKRGLNYVEAGETDETDKQTRIEIDAANKLKGIFDDILGKTSAAPIGGTV